MTLLPSADRPRGIRMGEWGRDLFSNRPCFASAGWSSSQTDPVLHQRAGVRLKQTLFFVSGLEFAPNRPCFASAGWSSSQTDPVFHQRAGVRLKQTLFCISGLEFIPNRPCFSSAGWSSPQTDPVLHQRAGVHLKQTLFYTTECQRSETTFSCFLPHSKAHERTTRDTFLTLLLHPRKSFLFLNAHAFDTAFSRNT